MSGALARFRRFLDDAIVRRLVRNAGPNTLASVATSVLGMARSAILARALGIASFGELAIIVATSTLVKQLFSVRTWEWTTVELAHAMGANDGPRIVAVIRVSRWLGLATSALATLTLVTLSGPITGLANGSVRLAHHLAVYSVIHLVTALDEPSVALLRVAGRFDWMARYQSASSVLRLVSVLPLLAWPLGLGFSVLVSVLAQIPASVWLGLEARRAIRRILPETLAPVATANVSLRGEWRRHAVTLATMSATDTLKTASADADPILIGHFGDATEVGQYKAASSLVLGLHSLATPLYMVFYPELARAVGARDEALVVALRRRLTAIGLLLGSVMAAGVVVLGPFVLPLIFGDGVRESVIDVQWMALSFFAFAAHWANPLFVSLRRPLRSMGMTFAALVVKTACMLLLVPRYGSAGAAVAFSAFFVTSVVAAVVLSRDYRALLRALVPAAPPAPVAEGTRGSTTR